MPVAAFQSIFPWNQELISTHPLLNDSELRNRITNAATAYGEWKNKTFAQRGDILKKTATLLRRDLEVLATLISREMGKVISESRAEIEKCAWACDFYAENGAAFLQDEILEAGYTKSLVSFEPVGAVLAIMPWNFPFWQVFRFAAPTLMAGNVCLLKHAPNVCGCALAIEQIFLEAGATEGVFTSLILDVPAVEKIISSSIVQAVTLTGSERAGSSVAAIAGKHIRKSVMELGGSDALIVLADADLQKAAETAIQSRMQNAGQSCIAAKRFIVVKEAETAFLDKLLTEIKKLKQGNPLEKGISTGPVARPDLAEHIQKQMQDAIQKGATLLHGGEASGCNVQPALLSSVKKGMSVYEEETFGPLAVVITAKNEEDAIHLANDSAYGLGGSIWTRNLEKGFALAKKMESGAVFINALVKSDPRLPFGGIKQSGYGRELGKTGIREFVNIKAIAGQSA
ncbi:MAG: NAD-dependent succinate-semialdehyde dehydrogenase [Bacteroidota bacterium]|nr:NAD-dependent succinate-semialdehyde dehydrogenase [Bacteroidota bacterium]